uniref:Retrotransposon gag domain-containing protein n=1 Tax=Chenopodium quinoa TaxID=63459 RepID=A0A803N3H9_CHEQI
MVGSNSGFRGGEGQGGCVEAGKGSGVSLVVGGGSGNRPGRMRGWLGGGDGDPETYLDWERRLDRLFRYINLVNTKSFHYAILKLTKYASLWFKSFQNQWERDGKAQLTTWTELKQNMKKKFVPRSHKQDLFLRLNSLQQGNMTIDNYIKEFEKLYIACDCKDEEEQKIAKFVLGLNASLHFKVELQSLTTFDDICSLAMKLEKAEQGEEFRFWAIFGTKNNDIDGKFWDYLEKHFCEANGPRLQQLRAATALCKQLPTMSI